MVSEMSAQHINLRDNVLRNVAAQGEGGAAWLAQFPNLIQKLEADWGIRVGQIFPNATEACVAAAVIADGVEVALKIPTVGIEKADREFRALRAANGLGYVWLLRHDQASGVLLG